MAALVTNKGLLRLVQQGLESTNYNAARNWQTLSIDDSSNAFAAGDTALNTGGAVSNAFDVAFDSTPTETGTATGVMVATIPTGSGNFTIRRIAIHDDTAANVTTSSTTLCGGVDAQALTKTSDFSITFTLNLTITDNS